MRHPLSHCLHLICLILLIRSSDRDILELLDIALKKPYIVSNTVILDRDEFQKNDEKQLLIGRLVLGNFLSRYHRI